MNISLSTAGSKKKKPSIGYGLNPRQPPRGTSNKGTPSRLNVFGDDDDDDDDGSGDGDGTTGGSGQQSGRAIVNQQIAKEQAALRRRAEAALAAVEDPSMYDYDGAYDSFKPKEDVDDAKRRSQHAGEERKSRYIGDLLKAAKVRGRERDAINERKIAREQEEEDAKAEYQGKEKFVTKAYKRKLEERKQWETEQEELNREEEANDVTKKTAGAAFASFYGNLNRNVAVGGGEQIDVIVNDTEDNKEPAETVDDEFDPREGGGIGFLGGFERSSPPKLDENLKSESPNDPARNDDFSGTTQPEEQPMSMREIREKKVAEARVRYLQRKQAALEQ